jgi:hypothetical protein
MLTTSIIAGMSGRFGITRQMRSIDPIMRHAPEKDPALFRLRFFARLVNKKTSACHLGRHTITCW